MTAPTAIDPFTSQIIRHKLDNIVDEAIVALENVSGSPITTEGHDMMVSLYTAEGDLLLGGVGFLHHITSAARAVKHIIELFEDGLGIHEGDSFFFNDSYSGALHPPDVFMITPIFSEGVRVGFVANFVHATDIGAIDPGGFSPNARTSYDEGFQTQGMKLVERGVLREDIFNTVLNNVRDPGMVALDLKSQLAANHVAVTRMVHLHAEYGTELVDATVAQLIAESEQLMRDRLRSLPDGEWSARAYVDSAGDGYKAELKMTKEGDTLTYDFTGSDPQAPIGINCSYWATLGGLFAPIFPLLAWDITWNEGLTRPVRLIAPEGTVVNCQRPAPLSLATVSMINIVNNLSTIVLSKMLGASPEFRHRATAVWYGSHPPCMCHGHDRDGDWYTVSLTDSFAGSGGGVAFHDGIDVGGEIPNVVSRWANVEHHELRTPVLYLYRRLVQDSGGPGKFRGGLGHEYGFTPHDTGGRDMGLVCCGKGAYVPTSLGVFGGYAGCNLGYTTLRESKPLEDWPGTFTEAHGTEREDKQWGSQTLRLGDSQHLRMTAGGGYGDPLDREPSAVVADVAKGAVSVEAARTAYGVLLTAGGELDEEGTSRERAEHRAARVGCEAGELRPAAEVAPSGRRISEYLQRTAAEETQCLWCGHVIAGPKEDWKDHASVRTAPLSNGGPHRPDDGRFALLEACCPGCGTLIDIDLTNGSDPVLHDRVRSWPTE
jgi:N-methylhydantoinase B